MSRLQHLRKFTERTRILGADQLGYVTGFDRHMLDREWTLNHADDHAMVQARIDVPMGGVHWDQHGLSSFDGLMLCPNDDNPFTFQAKYDFIRDRMAVQPTQAYWNSLGPTRTKSYRKLGLWLE